MPKSANMPAGSVLFQSKGVGGGMFSEHDRQQPHPALRAPPQHPVYACKRLADMLTPQRSRRLRIVPKWESGIIAVFYRNALFMK